MNQAAKKRPSLNGTLDYFIPISLQVNPDSHRRARMFMLSHAFGPFLGNVIPLYLWLMGIVQIDARFWTFVVSITIFWAYPIALKLTGRYQLLSFLSVQNLIFCILWACLAYGGIFSPFLSWMLIIPLLSFFYLPTTGWIRNVLLLQIMGSVAVFATVIIHDYRLPVVNLEKFQLIGIISIISASIYVAMMSLYFAKIYKEQREFERELGDLVATSDNLRNLTQAAERASAAKADFVASMSHELRTPLNAVIGYSQLLLDDAHDEGDEETARDLEHIHGAGAHLLRLVNDILDFSKIDAGKMEVRPTQGVVGREFDELLTELRPELSARNFSLVCDFHNQDDQMRLDWQLLRRAVSHLALGMCNEGDGEIHIRTSRPARNRLDLTVASSRGIPGGDHSDSLFDIFSDDADFSPTKYGGAGISFALSQRYAGLIGGTIVVESGRGGQDYFRLSFPLARATRQLDERIAA